MSAQGWDPQPCPQEVAARLEQARARTGLKVMTSTQIACGRMFDTAATGASAAPCSRSCGPHEMRGRLAAVPGSDSPQDWPRARWIMGRVIRWVCSMPQGLGPCACGAVRTVRGEHGALQGLRLWKGTCCALGVMRGELGSERDGRSRTNGAQVCLLGCSG